MGDDAKKPYCFEINTPDRVYLIQAGGEEDRAEWVQAIEDAIPEFLEDDALVELVIERKDSRREERREEVIAALSASSLQGADDDSEEEEVEEAEAAPAFRSKCGWLTKEGGQHKSRKKRWFVLDGYFLHYFKSDKDKVPAGSIDLKSSKGTTILDPAGSRWAFELITPERVYYIEADSEKLRNEWLEALEDTFALVKPSAGAVAVFPPIDLFILKLAHVFFFFPLARMELERGDSSRSAERATRAGKSAFLSWRVPGSSTTAMKSVTSPWVLLTLASAEG